MDIQHTELITRIMYRSDYVNMKRMRIYLTVLCVVVIITVGFVCIYKQEGAAYFSNEFTEKFKISDLNNDDVRERAKNSGYYRVSEDYNASGNVSVWELRLPITDEFIMTSYFITSTHAHEYSFQQKNRLAWWKTYKRESLRSDYSKMASKSKYQCDATIDTGTENIYIATYGETVSECVSKIENVLLKMYSDLVVSYNDTKK